ncbi:hypothetical protein DBR39_23690 [Chryseobacterium sp. KBW03]|uniref:hypothetical protein n=1 Tax=Chryseobacterium sp. KBW03 TaxID=2153362 RepID=UPI000F5A7EE6|nr:hypothetical protein [Chryseobacterium sp. KBW03]RQO32941.1 hypothetical protein DBR39_23690 [Chryseobacterium sp. KBW03]
MASLIAPEYFNNHIAVEGEIIVKSVPNDAGSVLVWNPTTKKISQRTKAEIIADLDVMTLSTNQFVHGQKSFMSFGLPNEYANNLWVRSDDGSEPGITFWKTGFVSSTLTLRNDGFHFGVGTSNHYEHVKAEGFRKNGSSNNYFLTGGGADYDSRKKEDSYIHSSRDFASGTLIETDVDYSVTYGEQFLLEMKGNMYSNGNYLPLDFKLQGYIYNDTIISEGGYSTLSYFNYVIALNSNGKLTFWFPRLGYWQGFDAKLTSGYGGLDQGRNRVISVSDNPDPGGTKRLQINLKHLLTKEELVSENIFWEKKNVGGYWALDSDKPIGGLNGNAAQVILSGGLLASSSYTDSQFIPANGIHSKGFVQSDEGFQNRFYKVNERNRIWSFANADNYGLSYFQGNNHILGEGISFHFGDASTTGFKTFIQNNGRIFSELDGNSGDWKHKVYNANNYLGADYIGGGQEKPNSIYFGPGKLKLQMLEGSQMGNSNFGWSDVLWMSSYSGSDVKKSTAIVSSKYNDRIGFVKQNYDAADWGTFQEFWTTNNLTNPATQTDLDNYYHINKGAGISNQSELVPNGLQSISTANSGSNFDGELSDKTLEGTFASFNGYSKTSKNLGFTLFVPTSKEQGVYYKTWYGGNQTPWKRLAEYSDLSAFVSASELGNYLRKDGGTMTGAFNMESPAMLGRWKSTAQTGNYLTWEKYDGTKAIAYMGADGGAASGGGSGDNFAVRAVNNGDLLLSSDSGVVKIQGAIPWTSSNFNPSEYLAKRGGHQDAAAVKTDFPLSVTDWASGTAFSSTYGNSLHIAGSNTWYHRIDFPLFSDHLEYWQGINTTVMTKKGNIPLLSDGERLWTTNNFNPDHKVNSSENAETLGFSNGLSTDAPYIYHKTDGYVFLATRSWAISRFVDVDGQQNITGLKIIKGRARNTGTGWGNTNASSDYSFLVETESGSNTDNQYTGSIGFFSNSGAQAGIYVRSNDQNGTSMAFATTNSFAAGPQIAMTIDNQGTVNHLRTRPTFQGNVIWDAGNLTTAMISNWNDKFKNLKYVADLNLVSESGIYRQESPSSGFNYTTTLNLNSSDGRQQLTIDRGGNGMKFRGNNSGSGNTGWGLWRTVWSDADFSQSHIDNWNNMSNDGIILNQQFTNITGNGLFVVDNHHGGESGIYNKKDDFYLTVLKDEYYKYSSTYKGWEGINFNRGDYRIGIGTKANGADKVNVSGSVKATENFKSKDEQPNTLFIPNGELAYLDDEITNEDNRMRLSHRMIEQQSGVQYYDSDNRMLVIRCTDPNTHFTLGKCFPGQRILILNANEHSAQGFDIKSTGTSYKIKPFTSIQLFVWDEKTVYKYAENQMY